MRKTNPSGIVCLVLLSLTACTKSTPENNNYKLATLAATAVDSVVIPADSATAGTIQFFMNRWGPKRFTVHAYTEKAAPATASLTVTVNASTIITKISPALFGNNVNQYMGQIVNEPVLMSQITNLHPG
jgi:hypothetical protein